MGIPAPLSRKLRDKLGTEAGEELVTWLAEMRAEHQESLARMDARMDAREARMVERFNALERRMDERFNTVDQRFGSIEVRIAEVRADLMKWSFVFWCGAVAAIAALAGVLRAP